VALFFLFIALSGSLWFANDSNAGKFFDRLPHFFDFVDEHGAARRPRGLPRHVRPAFALCRRQPEIRLPRRPDLSHRGSVYMPEYVYKMLETINIALVSTLIGISPSASCSASWRLPTSSPSAWLRFFVRRFMEILRAFPEIVIAGFFLAILSIGPMPPIIAVSIHTIGALGKLFFEVVENADMKADEGLRAVGASWVERVWFGIVPQVMPNFLSYGLLRLEINVRASTIIGAVGGGGIGEVATPVDRPQPRGQDHAIIILLLITIIAVDQFSAWLRRKTGRRPGLRLRPIGGLRS
jgi:phosphonate transport system permease protein